MKKLAILLFGLLLFMPSVMHAQAIEPSSVTASTSEELHAQYISLIEELIVVLTNQLTELETQIAKIQANQDTLQASQNKIMDTTNKVVETATPVTLEVPSLPTVSLGDQYCENTSIKRRVVINGSDWTYGTSAIFPKEGTSVPPAFNDWLRLGLNRGYSTELPGTPYPGNYSYKITLYKDAPAYGGVAIPENQILEISGDTNLDLNCSISPQT